MALSRWEDDGGAVATDPQCTTIAPVAPLEIPHSSQVDVVQLRVRIIALENLVIGLLADANERQINRVREMAEYISPRSGFTPHPLTVHAAAQMINLTERAAQFRQLKPS
jgi:hypothetical protein